MTGREPWTPQSDTPLEEPAPRSTRFARGSMAPPVGDADDTAPRVRLVALFEHEPVVPVSLDRARPPAVAPRPRKTRGAPWMLTAGVIAVMLLLGWLMVTR